MSNAKRKEKIIIKLMNITIQRKIENNIILLLKAHTQNRCRANKRIVRCMELHWNCELELEGMPLLYVSLIVR